MRVVNKVSLWIGVYVPRKYSRYRGSKKGSQGEWVFVSGRVRNAEWSHASGC